MNDQEILDALNKSEASPPVLCMSERSVTFVAHAAMELSESEDSYIKESSIREQNNFAKSAGRRWNGVRKKASQRN